jgi:U3 small nucleolar RNA-associated protein 4
MWNPLQGLWSQETIFRGGKDRSIEGLAWTQDLEDESEEDDAQKQVGKLRLFSIGFSSSITEWDLALGVPARHANGNFGAIWCLAAQPRWTSKREGNAQSDSSADPRHDQYLAGGCEDGTIVLFSTEVGDLRYLRTMGKPPTKKPRILSLTWKDRKTIVAGYSDSTIRVYDIRSRQTLRNMSLGKPAAGGNETLVWAVKCLPDGTILSGDSAGDLKIWDGNNYSLVQRLNCHHADVLDITTNANGTMIITGGADRRTVAYRPVGVEKGKGSHRWAEIMHRRFHEHDVKAVASFESQDLSIVVAGGLDTVPVVMPLRKWQKEYHRALSHLPRSPQMSSAPLARLFISWWEREVNVWHLSRHDKPLEEADSPRSYPDSHTLLARILVNGDENITSAQISQDGSLLVVATVSTVRVFQLRRKREPMSGRLILRTRKLETLPSLESFGARLVTFSPDCRWLCCIRSNNEVVLVRIEAAVDAKAMPNFTKYVVKLNRSISKRVIREGTLGLGDYKDIINNVCFSADSRLLAVGDLSGRIATWVLEGLEERGNQLTADSLAKRASASSDGSDSSSPSSEADSSDEEDENIVIHGQRWRKSPAGATLPQLDSPLLAMSFRPGSPKSRRRPNGADVGSHPTRHTPQPRAHDLPVGEDRLIAVTVEHKVVEFRVLQRKLSDWSRRNPASYLPQKFQQIRERAMGCFWDVSSIHERLWLYGSTWVFMLDLAQDLPMEQVVDKLGTHTLDQPSRQSKKRKREDLEAEELRKRDSGAGGTMPLSESYVGVGSSVGKFKSPRKGEAEGQQLEGPPKPASDADEEDFDDGSGTLAVLRRMPQAEDIGTSQLNGHVGNRVNGIANHSKTDASPGKSTGEGTKGPPSFLSLKYRSILGIVPIGGASEEQVESLDTTEGENSAPSQGLEVAIVERPLWDIELPPSFDGGQDWET